MISAPGPLHALDGGPLPVERLLKALRKAFTVQANPAQAVRRQRLDTFDHLLARVGMTLEQLTTPRRGTRLLLRRVGAPDLVTTVEGQRWPAMADALPAGALRDAVAPIIGIRALVQQGDERRTIRRIDLRNGDGKVVARIALDEPVSASRSRGGAPTVSVLPLRGYDADARKALAIGERVGLIDETTATDADADASAPAPKPAPPHRDDPAAALLAQALQGFSAAMADNLPGLIDDIDTEFLHDLRVAVRRSRSTLKLGRPALPDTFATRWEPAFKWIGDLTTPVRDLDVYQLDLPTMAGWLVAATPADLQPFAEHLARRRTTARRTLLRGLRGTRYRTLVAEWDHDLAALAALAAAPTEDGPTAGALADTAVSRSYRRVARGGAAIDVDSPPEDLHTLRKRCKELRYALEVFAPVLDAAKRKQAVADLKGLQDVLGRFQDSEVQRLALRDFAAEMMADGTSPAAVLAMGELIAHLEAEQARARRDFEAAFATFARPASAERMLHLGGRP